MPTVFEDAGELLAELCREAAAGGASGWFVESLEKKVARLRRPETIVEARQILGIVETLEGLTRRRSSRFDEVVAELRGLLAPIDAVWRLGGGGDA